MIQFRLNIFVFTAVVMVAVVADSDRASELKCLVCENLISEMDKAVRKVNPKTEMNVGSINSNKKIQYLRSETHLTDVMDLLCKNFEEYAEATYKDTGKRTIIRFLDEHGNMDPDMSKVDFVQTEDLNKGLKFYCQLIVEEHEDHIFEAFHDEGPTTQELIDTICHSENAPCSPKVKAKKAAEEL